MYKCRHCGEVFEDYEARHDREQIGECFGIPAYMTYSRCPFCGADEIDDAYCCKVCGEWFLDEELEDGACKECREEIQTTYKRDFDTCAEISAVLPKEAVNLSPIYTAIFTEEEIEKILTLCAKTVNIDCSAFIDMDLEWFVDQIIKRKEEKKNG